MKFILILPTLITSLSSRHLERRADGDTLSLYEHSSYNGREWKFTPRIFCKTLDGDARNQASSAHWRVKAPRNFKVQFYTEDNCRGNMKEWPGDQRYEDQPSNFGADGINDVIKSFRLVQQD
ncbi:hypothetical protein CONCODRAFT_13083 [Conidiobolus coronatus NRRL 28638]|uniref:Beta/gamma crystallin 'Greek key' domain-containing protein n=1 Tax=Conidiobolus coronatus (strain ATCC 28846 / CBS 209.66 / NRRL 28638) TaxID=796925 RepID=A0A137NRF6_CONC2|nr:hypothetical protein CONCODRAFT_13083 [Conidiobolus coronatus NRRL 28638]|eukprot:KXN65349.1 hypothetical protein CONCODRAFT_13083 [Conidiobolus coronatus NRRL 28638]